MPEKHEFLPMSLVTFSRSKDEQAYLLYSRGFESGPGIHRDGQGSPWMIDADSQARRITDPMNSVEERGSLIQKRAR